MEAGATAVAHPVVAAMNGATVSILLRLKHAVMFEDFQVCFGCQERESGGDVSRWGAGKVERPRRGVFDFPRV